MANKLEHYKEILSVLPRNNIKNSRRYLTAASQIKNETILYKNSIVSEIKRRYERFISIPKIDSIDKISSNLADVKSNLYLLNKLNSPYEKSGLDKVLYDLGKYYKTDLEKVNQEILLTIEKFKTVGVILKKEDFDYGSYVSKYMEVFFNEINDLKSSLLKDTFDELYWKCPDLIHYIKINFRHLYFKNIKSFEKYYSNRLVDLNIKDNGNYYNNYKNTLKELLDLESKDIRLIEDRFLLGNLDIKDYSIDKIDKISSSLFLNKLEDEDSVREARITLLKLSYTLYEYKKYLKFKYIIDDIKSIYQEKNSNKSLIKNTLKNIEKKEKIISKSNSKIRFKKFFGKSEKSFEKLYSAINNSLVELKDLYKEYDINNFKEKIANVLNDNSSILDALHLVYSYRINLLKIVENKYEDITNEDIVKEFDELDEFINYPNITIINNLSIVDEKDVPLIIVDKYKLMDINITKEMLEDGNLDNLISSVDKLLINYHIKDSSISVDDISFMCEAKKIIEKNSN